MAQSMKHTASSSPGENYQDANRLRGSFVSLAESLLESIQEVFPECDETTTARRLFGAIVKGDSAAEDRFLRKCMDEMRCRQDRVKQHDVEALFEIADGLSLLKTINLRGKWRDPDFSDKSKENLWQYVDALQTYGGLYCAVPPAVMAQIEKVALEVSEKMAGGNFDVSKLDLTSIGKDLITSLSAEEVEEFEGSLTDVYACVGNVASLLAKQNGNESFDVAAMMNCIQSMQANVVQGAKRDGSGGADFGALLQQLGSGSSVGSNPMLTQALASFAKGVMGSGGNGILGKTTRNDAGAGNAPFAVDDDKSGISIATGPPPSKKRKKRHATDHNT